MLIMNGILKNSTVNTFDKHTSEVRSNWVNLHKLLKKIIYKENKTKILAFRVKGGLQM